MTTPHTPGPWKASSRYIAAGDYHLAVTTNAPLKMNQEWEANARLMAASPDLLQAVIDLLAVAPTKAPAAGLLVGIKEKHEDAIRSAKQAIAKATKQIS